MDNYQKFFYLIKLSTQNNALDFGAHMDVSKHPITMYIRRLITPKKHFFKIF